MTNPYNISQRQAITEYRNAHKLGKNVSDAQVVKHMQSSGKLPKAFQSLSNQKKTSGKPNSVMTSKSKNVQNNQSQLKSLGYKDSKGAGSKIKAKNGKTYTVVGSAIWNTVLVCVGAFAGSQIDNILNILDNVSHIVLILLIVIFIVCAFLFYKSRLKKKANSEDENTDINE